MMCLGEWEAKFAFLIYVELGEGLGGWATCVIFGKNLNGEA